MVLHRNPWLTRCGQDQLRTKTPIALRANSTRPSKNVGTRAIAILLLHLFALRTHGTAVEKGKNPSIRQHPPPFLTRSTPGPARASLCQARPRAPAPKRKSGLTSWSTTIFLRRGHLTPTPAPASGAAHSPSNAAKRESTASERVRPPIVGRRPPSCTARFLRSSTTGAGDGDPRRALHSARAHLIVRVARPEPAAHDPPRRSWTRAVGAMTLPALLPLLQTNAVSTRPTGGTIPGPERTCL